MKKIFVSFIALAAVLASCTKNNTPMTPEEQRDVIAEAAQKLADHADVPNWSEDFDLIKDAVMSFDDITHNMDDKEIAPLMQYIQENYAKTVSYGGLTYTSVVLSNLNGVAVISKVGGEYKGTFTPTEEGGLSVTYPTANRGLCTVAFEASKEIAGEVNLTSSDEGETNVITIKVPKTVTVAVWVGGELEASLVIEPYVNKTTNILDDYAMNAALTVADYALNLNIAEFDMKNASISEAIYHKKQVLESVAVSVKNMDLGDLQDFENVSFGQGNVDVNIVDLVSIKGTVDIDEFMPLAMQINETFETAAEAQSLADDLNDAFALNVYYNNNLGFVQAHLEFEVYADEQLKGEGTHEEYGVSPVIVFADGSRNEVPEFINEKLMVKIEAIFTELLARIKEKINPDVD